MAADLPPSDFDDFFESLQSLLVEEKLETVGQECVRLVAALTGVPVAALFLTGSEGELSEY